MLKPSLQVTKGAMPQFCIPFYANYTILATQRRGAWPNAPPKYALGWHSNRGSVQTEVLRYFVSFSSANKRANYISEVESSRTFLALRTSSKTHFEVIINIIIIIIFIYLPSDVISQEKTATSSRSITKASKYAIPLKPNSQNLQSQSDI